MKKLQLVEIEWDDAHSTAGGGEQWTGLDQFEKVWDRGSPCKSVGYVFRETDEAIALASSYTTDALNEKIELVSGTIIIPRGMIRRKRILK